MKTENLHPTLPRDEAATPKPQACDLSISEFSQILLQASALLMESGAHCERIHRNIQRLASKSPFLVEMFISFNAISVSLSDKSNAQVVHTATKAIKHHGIHFGVVTNASVLTWKFHDDEISFDELQTQLKALKDTKRHPVWMVRLFIGIACACLCVLVGGNWIDSACTFVASVVGLTVKQEMTKRGFNLMVVFMAASIVTTLIAGLDVLYGLGSFPGSSVATAVLYLIPGVPLINSIIDLLKGYMSIGIARGTFAGFILLCIAVGMFVGISVVGLKNF
ncbi:MAG: hypothetical protein BGN96_10510 [Bacteroidales bacterium 45-6]|nr:MAG: hypothetical protein BGN96_10510 [Bacteroidales bacterium 45-6]